MIALQKHYNAPSEGDRRKKVARSDLDKLFYRIEFIFSFKKYVTTKKSNFILLESTTYQNMKKKKYARY